MEHTDRAERRQRIAQIAAEVIAREGGDAATLRHIAAQAGCSTTLITDCFEDKTDLLLCAYQRVSSNTLTRFEQRIAHRPGDILDGLVSLSAIDELSWCGWRVHVAFWERAMRDPLLAAEQRACSERSRRYIENAISTAYGPRGDIAGVAQLVIILIHGISIQVLFEQEHWSHERVRALLAGQIETFLRRGLIVSPRAVP